MQYAAEPFVSYRFEALRGQLGMAAARLIEQAILAEAERQRIDGLPSTWEARAEEYEAAGEADVATACRERAEFLRMYPELGATHSIRECVALAIEEEAA